MFELGEKNLLTLAKDPIPAHLIPQYPGLKLKVALGGEETSALVSATESTPIQVIQRKAVKGELLRDRDLRYIPDYTENLRFRVKRKALCDADPAMRQLELKFCQSSILYFINVYGWTYDPRLLPETDPFTPMVTYPVQDDWLTWQLWSLKHKKNTLTEKSRDMGISWMGEFLDAYLCLFSSGVTIYQFSLKAEYVDNRAIDSLLGKQRLILSKLPDWMRGGWSEGDMVTDKKMYINFPSKRSYIKGDLTSSAGRGGRCLRATFDEFAHTEDSFAILEACSNLASSISYVSTVKGMGNAFAMMAHAPNVNKKTLHWSMHPLKNNDWAIYAKSDPMYADDSIWAQEQEISYQKSTTGRVFPEFSAFSESRYDWSHVQTDPYYRFDPKYEVYVGVDIGLSDPTAVVFYQYKPSHVDFRGFTEYSWVQIGEEEAPNKLVPEWADLLLDLARNHGYRYKHIVFDPYSGYKRDYYGKTYFQEFHNRGMHVVSRKLIGSPGENEGIAVMKGLLKTPGKFALCAQTCGKTIDAFQNWSYKTDRLSGLVLPDAEPKHYKYSHLMKAIIYLMYYNNLPKSKMPDYTKFRWDFR